MIEVKKKTIILDRDGVINVDSKSYIKSSEEWHPLPGSLEAIVLLQNAGFQVFIATNQSGIGRGFYSEAVLDQMHAKMQSLIYDLGGRALDGIFYCPHLPDAKCECRKPNPGMLLSISRVHSVDLTFAYFVGDSLKDLDAAAAVGAHGVLVLTGNGVTTQASLMPKHSGVPVFDSLLGFVDSLLVK